MINSNLLDEPHSCEESLKENKLSRNKRATQIKIIISILFVCVILFSGYSYVSNHLQEIKSHLPYEKLCSFSDGLKKDNCLVNAAFNTQNLKFCSDVNSPLLKDTCYLMFEICDAVSNNYFSYYCNRYSDFRPHMKSFVTRSPNIRVVNIEKQCDSLNPYSKLFCNYDYVFSVSNKNFSKALELCDTLEEHDEECKFLLSFKLIPNIAQNLSFFRDYCSKFNKPEWKAECYYIIADELNALQDEKFLRNISDACEESMKSRNFVCFNHNVINVPADEQLNFCKIIPNVYKSSCYSGIGTSLGKQYMNLNQDMTLSEAISKCDNLTNNTEYIKSCKNGQGYSIILIMSAQEQNLSNYIKVCNEFESMVCYYWIGNVRLTEKIDVTEMKFIITDLQTLSYEKKILYLEGLIDRYRLLGAYSNEAIKICGLMNGQLQNDCKDIVSDSYKAFP